MDDEKLEGCHLQLYFSRYQTYTGVNLYLSFGIFRIYQTKKELIRFK